MKVNLLLGLSLLCLLLIHEVQAQWGGDPYWWGGGMSPRRAWWRMYRRALMERDRELYWREFGRPWWMYESGGAPWGPNRDNQWDGQQQQGGWDQGQNNNNQWNQHQQGQQQQSGWTSPRGPEPTTTTTQATTTVIPGPPGI